MRHLAALVRWTRKKPAGAPTDFVQDVLVHRKQIAQLWADGRPTDSDGDILPAPIPRPYLSGGFGGFASPAFMARRLQQLRRIRNLYRDGYKITQILPSDKGENTQKPCVLCCVEQTGRPGARGWGCRPGPVPWLGGSLRDGQPPVLAKGRSSWVGLGAAHPIPAQVI